MFENAAAQELAAHGYALYYFNSKKQGELDFVIEHEGNVLPLDVYKRQACMGRACPARSFPANNRLSGRDIMSW